MLNPAEKKLLEEMQRSILIFKGQLSELTVQNGEGDVFGNTISHLQDTFSSLKRDITKISFS